MFGNIVLKYEKESLVERKGGVLTMRQGSVDGGRMWAVDQMLKLKVVQIFQYLVVQKESTAVLIWKVQFLKIAPKVTKYLGYFFKKL